jgi:hypothetical protein
VAVGHDVLKSLGAVDPQGRVSTTSVAATAMDALSSQANQALGSAVSDRYFFTPGELGELAGALGIQIGAAAVGVKEIQLAVDIGGTVSSLRTMINTARDNPNWLSDASFWAGFIGVLLGLIGLGSWSGKRKAIEWILSTGVFLNAGPVLVQLERDLYDESLDEAERERRVKEDLKRLAQIVLLPLLQHGQHGDSADQPEPSPTSSALHGVDADAAADASTPPQEASAAGVADKTSTAPAQTSTESVIDTLNADESPLPDNILPFRAVEPRPQAIEATGEIIPLPRHDASEPARITDTQTEAEASRPAVDLEAEAELQMAVGYTPSFMERSSLTLIHDADAIVASTEGGGDRPPRPAASPPPTPAPTPSRTPGTPRGSRVDPGSAPGATRGAESEDEPRIHTAERDRQLEVLENLQTLYTGEQAETAPLDPEAPVVRALTEQDINAVVATRGPTITPRDEGRVIANESEAEQQARRAALAPAAAPRDEGRVIANESEAEQQARRAALAPRAAPPGSLDYQLHPVPAPADRAARAEAWQRRLDEIVHKHHTEQKRARLEKWIPAAEPHAAPQEAPPDELRDAPEAAARIPQPPEPAQQAKPEASSYLEEEMRDWLDFGVEEPQPGWKKSGTEASDADVLDARDLVLPEQPPPESKPPVLHPDEEALLADLERRLREAGAAPKLTDVDRMWDADDEPTLVEIARIIRDPDDEPTVIIERPTPEPDHEQPGRIDDAARDPDEEPTVRMEREGIVTYEPTITERNETDISAAQTQPPAKRPAEHEGEKSHHEPSSMVPPDEQERARRRKKDRERK